MLKIIGTFVLISFASFVGLSQVEISQKLFRIKLNDKCGYISQEGEIIVPPKFDFCSGFADGMAAVSISKRSGYINEAGEIVIPLQFEGFFSEYFSDGLATVKIPKKNGGVDLGYVDKRGNLQLLQNFSEIYSFHEGLARVEKNGKSGYIDKNMKVVIPLKYDFAGSFSEGLAIVSEKLGSGKDYYIDKSGRKVIVNYGSGGSYFSDGLARFHLKDTRYGYQYGFIDTKGKVVIKPQYGYHCLFNEGLACAEEDGKWGFIDKTGKFVIEPQFDEAEDFSADGITSVSLNGKWGFIDKTGKFLVEPQFDEAEWINGLGLVEIEGKERYINRKGIFVW
jgi:hypothetical protein